MKYFLNKLKVAWWVIIGKYKHFVILSITTPEGEKMMADKGFDIDYTWMHLSKFAAHKLIKGAASIKDDIDMILDKAQIEADQIQ